MPKFSPHAQGTDAWLIEKVGILSASRFADAISFDKKGNETAKRKKLKYELLAERMRQRKKDVYVTKSMEWGIIMEPESRQAYEAFTGNIVTQCGFCFHDTIDGLGVSPDGLISSDGLLELKNPELETHLMYIDEGVIPEAYLPQLQLQCFVMGRKWNDFCSFHPEAIEESKLFIKRYIATDEDMAMVERAALVFLQELDILWSKYTSGN